MGETLRPCDSALKSGALDALERAKYEAMLGKWELVRVFADLASGCAKQLCPNEEGENVGQERTDPS